MARDLFRAAGSKVDGGDRAVGVLAYRMPTGRLNMRRIRYRRFFSLAELNVAIGRLRDELNMRVMRGYGASRADLFATLDRPHLQPLPQAAYAFTRQSLIGVNAPGSLWTIMSRWTAPGIPCPSA